MPNKNFAYSSVTVAPSPADSGLTLEVADGSLFPVTPFQATIWPTGEQPFATNAEIVTVTDVTGDTLTIVRAQEGTVARTVVVGDQIAQTITVKTVEDLSPYLTDGQLTGDRTIDLNGKVLNFSQDGIPFLSIDPLSLAVTIKSHESTGGGNEGSMLFQSDPGFGSFNLNAIFNGGADVLIEGFNDVSEKTLEYTADTHTFNGDVIAADLAGNGVGVAAIDNDGKLSWSAGGSSVNNPLMVQIFS